MGWQWHQLHYMHIICTLLQTNNHASTSSVNFLQAGCSFWRPTNSVKALKAKRHTQTCNEVQRGTEADMQASNWPRWWCCPSVWQRRVDWTTADQCRPPGQRLTSPVSPRRPSTITISWSLTQHMAITAVTCCLHVIWPGQLSLLPSWPSLQWRAVSKTTA